MRKLSFKIRKGTKALILGLSLLGVMGLSAFSHSIKVSVTKALVPIGLVATMKKKGVTLDAEEEKLFSTIDEAITEHTKGAIDADALKAAIDKVAIGMTPDQLKAFNENVETVKAQAILIDQLKTMGIPGSQRVDMSVMGQIRKGLKEAMPEILKMKAKDGNGFKIEIKFFNSCSTVGT